jgi:hypothetical protein
MVRIFLLTFTECEIPLLILISTVIQNVAIPNTPKPYMCYAISAMCFLLSMDSYRESFLAIKYIRKKPGEMDALDYIHELVKMSANPSNNDNPLPKLQEIRKKFSNDSGKELFIPREYSVCIMYYNHLIRLGAFVLP